MFDLDLLSRLDQGLARIAPDRPGTAACGRLAEPVEAVVRCPEMLARGRCPVAHGPRAEAPA